VWSDESRDAPGRREFLVPETKGLFILPHLIFLTNFNDLGLNCKNSLTLSVELGELLVNCVSNPCITILGVIETNHPWVKSYNGSLLILSDINLLNLIVVELFIDSNLGSYRVLGYSKSSLGFHFLGSCQSISWNQVSILVYELEYSHKTLAISNYHIIWFRVEADSCELQFSSASIALLSLKSQSLIKAFGHIDVREGPSISIVSPDMDWKIVWASYELLIMSTLCLEALESSNVRAV
jgi:hypothetical protein